MNRMPFHPETDYAPIPFDNSVLNAAAEMKRLGLPWTPHTGCFVWDPEGRIEAPSPFPFRVYFILSLPRFIGIFGSIDAMREQLVWVPTWYQARQLCIEQRIEPPSDPSPNPARDLERLYLRIGESLRQDS